MCVCMCVMCEVAMFLLMIFSGEVSANDAKIIF